MDPPVRFPVAVWVGVVPVILYAVACQWITPLVAVPAPLRLDVVVVAVFGGMTLGPWGRGVGRWIAPFANTAPVAPGVAGALFGAALVTPWVAVPWLVVPAVAFAWVGRNRRESRGRSGAARKGEGGAEGQGRSPRRRRRGVTFLVFLLAALVNMSVVAALNARGLRFDSEDFAEMDFRVNTLLADVPLHDVFAIDLVGRETATMTDVAMTFRRFSPAQSTPAMVGLSMLRGVLGLTFRWEDPRWVDEEASFVHRLDEDDRSRSTLEPGINWGIWKLLYALPEEGAVETLNGTVHVAVACALGEGPSGHRLYLSFHVREVNWTTPFYMALIDPFRRNLFYPPLLRQLAHLWEVG